MLKKTTKRFISIVMAAMMIISMIPFTAFAADETTASDLSGHWAENVITEWMDYGIINGYEDGTIRPNNKITRAEMTAMLDRVMDYQTKADNTFSDLGDSWYTDVILKANAAGVISGYPDGTVKPDATITRQEAVAMFSRVLSLDTKNAPEATFTDNADVADWAKDAVNAMAAADYIHGSEGQFRPNDGITRAEVVTILNNIFDKLYQKAGEYTGDVDGSAVINTDQVTLKDMTISGDLIIAEGVGDGHVVLDNVTVDGKLIVRGGGENSVIIKGDSKIDNISVERIDGAVRVAVEGNANVNAVLIDNGGQDVKIEGTVDTVNVAAANANVDITGAAKDINVADTATNATITVTSTATADNVSTSAENTTIIVAGAVSNIDIADTANNSVVTTQSNATVDKVTTAAGNTTVEGSGTVTDVVVGENASDATVTTEGTKVENNSSSNVTTSDNSVIAPGTTDTTPGGTTETPSVPSTPSTPSVTYYTVTYVTTDGTAISTQSVASGSTATAPTADVEGMPSVEPGNKLTWYNDSEPFDFTTPITGNITLTAVVGSDDFAGGNGTKAYPYLIGNAEQFNAINNLSDDMKAGTEYYFEQTADIENFSTPVTNFCGVYDGNNKTISAAQLESSKAIALLQNVYGTTIIENLTLVSNKNVGLSTTVDPWYVDNLTIANIKATANEKVDFDQANFGFLMMGSICDDRTNPSKPQNITIKDCNVNASIQNTAHSTGGFIGSGYFPAQDYDMCPILTISNCSMTGDISGNTYAGLILGNPAYHTYIDQMCQMNNITDETDKANKVKAIVNVQNITFNGNIEAKYAGLFSANGSDIFLNKIYENTTQGTYQFTTKSNLLDQISDLKIFTSDNGYFINNNKYSYKLAFNVSAIGVTGGEMNGRNVLIPLTYISENSDMLLNTGNSIHAYDYNTAINQNIITASDQLNYNYICEGGFPVAIVKKDANTYLIFDSSKVTTVDSAVTTYVYGYQNDAFVGSKVINQAQN